MESAQFVRDAQRVHAALVELPDGRVVTTTGCKIHSPTRYTERELSYVGAECYILGIFATVVKENGKHYYGVSLLNTMVSIDPTSQSKIVVDGDDYYEFVFAPGATVFKNTQLVRTPTFVYRIYDEFISKGYIPWYMGYEELGHIFDSAKEFADANIGSNPEVTQLIASMLARDPADRSKYYRTRITEIGELVTNPPVFVPLKSVEYQATDLVTKIGGSYFSVGVTSALITQSTRREKIESLLTR